MVTAVPGAEDFTPHALTVIVWGPYMSGEAFVLGVVGVGKAVDAWCPTCDLGGCMQSIATYCAPLAESLLCLMLS